MGWEMKSWSRTIQCSIACLSIPYAAAGPPQAFDQWSMGNNKSISASCPSGFTCESVVSGNGFLQQNLTNNSDGDSFFHTIMVTEAAGQQSFIDENFVRQSDDPSPFASGIFDKQSISFAQTTKVADSQFDMATQLRPGWDSSNTDPNVEITQNVDEKSRKMYFGNKFYEGNYSLNTYLAINTDALGNRTGFFQELDQKVEDPGQFMRSGDLNDDGNRKDNVESTSGFYAEIDTQVFALRRKSGDFTSAGSASLSGGRNISWSAGDDIRAYLVGNAFHHSRTTQDGGSGVSLQNSKDDFPGYQTVTMNMVGYDNLTTVKSINYFEFADTQPNNWDQDFGPAPSVPRPTGLAGTGKDNINVRRQGPAPKQVSGLFTPTPVGPKYEGEGLPFSFGQWVALPGGDLRLECASGATCPNGGISGAGMAQRILASADGRQFIQSLITDPDASGTISNVDFAIESFVRMGGGNTQTNTSDGSNTNQTAPNGIALLQTLHSDDLSTRNRATNTDLSVEIRTGWASESDRPNVIIDLTIDEQFQTGGYLTHNFDYIANLDADGFVTGSATDIYTEGRNTARAYSTDYRNTTDTIEFVQLLRGGDMVSSSGSESSCVAMRNPERCQSFSWQPGDFLSATRYNVTSSIKEQANGWETLVLEDNLSDNRRMSNEFIRKDGSPGLGTFLTGGTRIRND